MSIEKGGYTPEEVKKEEVKKGEALLPLERISDIRKNLELNRFFFELGRVGEVAARLKVGIDKLEEMSAGEAGLNLEKGIKRNLDDISTFIEEAENMEVNEVKNKIGKVLKEIDVLYGFYEHDKNAFNKKHDDNKDE